MVSIFGAFGKAEAHNDKFTTCTRPALGLLMGFKLYLIWDFFVLSQPALNAGGFLLNDTAAVTLIGIIACFIPVVLAMPFLYLKYKEFKALPFKKALD